MNHYERLKVSPEAPPEVIRAAYRALAAKLHPDRKLGESGPGDPTHEDMAALNASYLVLMDAKSRVDYDQTLAQAAAAAQAAAVPPKRGSQRKRAAKDSAATPSFDQGADTRVDVGWLSTPPAAAEHWLREPKWMLAMVATFALALCALVWVLLQQGERMQFDRSLSSAHPGVGLPPDVQRTAPPVPQAGGDAAMAAEQAASVPELTPEQMANMSDAELLAAMPQVIGSKSPVLSQGEGFSALSGGANHMLDGQPLNLKLTPLQLPEHTQ